MIMGLWNENMDDNQNKREIYAMRDALLEKRCYGNTFRSASSMVYIWHPRVYKFWHTRGAALAPNGC